MGKTPPKEKEADGSPRKKAARVDDPALITASALSPTGKTPPKGVEAEESPRKKAPRLDDAALATVPGASKPNPTGKTQPKEEAEGSPPKRSRSPRSKSPRRQDKLPLPTVPESSELIVEGAARASDEKRCKCNHVITYSAIMKMARLLESKDAWTCCGCQREKDKGIVKTRPEKSDLLICVTCYDHLCCGVGSIAYPFGHSRAHALKKKHWFAVLYCDPERGYCFKCNAEMPMPVKFGEGDNEVGVQVIRSIVSRKLLAPPPSVGQTEAEVNPMVEMTGKGQAESHPSGFGLDLADKWPSYESRSSDAQGYAIRGIPNLGNTCYMSAVLQCLFVLGKLQERMLALDPPKGLLPELLKELFVLVEASAAGDVLDPTKVLDCVRLCKAPFFEVGAMEDSHEFLTALRDIWIEGEKIYNRQSDAPTVIDSIFRFKMLQTLSCKKCGHSSPTSHFFWDLTMHFPSKWHPTKSAASPQTSESPRSRKREIAVQLFPADVQRNLERMQTVSESGYSRAIGSEVTVEETHKPLEVDSTQTQCISQSQDVVQSPLQIQEGKSVDSLTEDLISIEDFLLLFSEDQVKWRCPNCAKDHEEPSASQSKNGEQIVGSGNEDDVGDTVKIYGFTTLPPVLALHLNRTSRLKGTDGIKINGHVRFMEYLDVKRFMDPSSVDKDSTLYRLAGVVEHIGEGSLKEEDGHYIAYVRARRLGNQQEGSSCSSSWFCADDRWIRQATLEQVLNCEAYILFYERMEDQGISGIRRQN
ncbi:unnamed protein product [Miscanthus lutarioriparius]|uniref:Ubiquitinyl hydrolase 1 n=1 Tax=Miscanthus lutarioriparius TaxID=422564 RepID=A0A811R448_9POAL|nr:unnamed protein product [Miscanthus lutarioriparius]